MVTHHAILLLVVQGNQKYEERDKDEDKVGIVVGHNS